jgi:hypothetical protein
VVARAKADTPTKAARLSVENIIGNNSKKLNKNRICEPLSVI